jgi:ceramide glucosyltransferase
VLVTIALGAIVAGTIVYSVLTILAARSYLAAKAALLGPLPRGRASFGSGSGIQSRDREGAVPVSVLKPLSGAEDQLEQNLRTFFTQDYPDYEILFAVRRADDPAAAVALKLAAEYPAIPSRLIVTGEPPYPNAKVYSLDKMKSAAKHELLVMSDSDIRVTPDMLRVIAAEFADPKVGLATCPYRAVPGRGLWSTLEAIGLNTHFLGGVLTARMIEGMKFALGPTIAARKVVLDGMGGFERLKDYLAEDFVMGKFADQLGYTVLLSSYVIEHHIGGQAFAANFKHRLRWARSTRRSRPAGYLGELFTMPLPWAVLLWIWAPQLAWAAAASILLRGCSAWACAGWVLRDRLAARFWYLIPAQDVLAFGVWIAGFFGNHIAWRGRKYRLHADGRFEPV